MTDQSDAAATPRASEVRIDVQGPDELGASIQLAARWAEMFPPPDSSENQQAAWLHRFRTAYEYVDAILHGVEPPSASE